MRPRTVHIEPCKDCGAYDRGYWLACQWADQNPEAYSAGQMPPCIEGRNPIGRWIAILLLVAAVIFLTALARGHL